MDYEATPVVLVVVNVVKLARLYQFTKLTIAKVCLRGCSRRLSRDGEKRGAERRSFV